MAIGHWSLLAAKVHPPVADRIQRQRTKCDSTLSFQGRVGIPIAFKIRSPLAQGFMTVEISWCMWLRLGASYVILGTTRTIEEETEDMVLDLQDHVFFIIIRVIVYSQSKEPDGFRVYETYLFRLVLQEKRMVRTRYWV